MKKMNYQTPEMEEVIVLSEEAVLLTMSGEGIETVQGEDNEDAE